MSVAEIQEPIDEKPVFSIRVAKANEAGLLAMEFDKIDVTVAQLAELKLFFEKTPADTDQEELPEALPRSSSLVSIVNQPPDVSGERLTEDEFVTKFGSVFCDKCSELQLRQWFLHIDANGRGSVGWDDFAGFLLLEQAETVAKEHCCFNGIPKVDKAQKHRNRAMVTKIWIHPTSGLIYTGGEEGDIHIWTADMTHIDTLKTQGTSMITDGFFATQGRTLVVSTVDQMLTQYSLFERRPIRRFVTTDKIYYNKIADRPPWANETYKNLEAPRKVETTILLDFPDVPSTMDVVSINGNEHAIIGMRTGDVQMYNIAKHRQDLRDARSGGVDEYLPSSISPVAKWPQLHNNSVSKLRLCPGMHGGFISVSWDRTIKLTAFDSERPLRVFGADQNYDHHENSIFSFSWNSALKMLATCGSDRDIFLWNPWINRPLYKFTSDSSTMVDIAFNEADQQLIALEAGKVIRIYDLRTYKALQVIQERSRLTPEDKFSALAFDSDRKIIVAASSYPEAFHVSGRVSKFPSNYIGHKHPPLGMLYNSVFQQLVTVDIHTVNMWKLSTGEKVASLSLGEERVITSFSLDQRERRLLLGTLDGELLIYNFANCQPIKYLEVVDPGVELTPCRYIIKPDQQGVQFFLGVNHDMLHFWYDNENLTIGADTLSIATATAAGAKQELTATATTTPTEPCEKSAKNAAGRVTCMCFIPPATVATGSVNGVISLINITSLHISYFLGKRTLTNEEIQMASKSMLSSEASQTVSTHYWYDTESDSDDEEEVRVVRLRSSSPHKSAADGVDDTADRLGSAGSGGGAGSRRRSILMDASVIGSPGMGRRKSLAVGQDGGGGGFTNMASRRRSIIISAEEAMAEGRRRSIAELGLPPGLSSPRSPRHSPRAARSPRAALSPRGEGRSPRSPRSGSNMGQFYSFKSVESMIYLHRHEVLISVMRDRWIHFWDPRFGRRLISYNGHHVGHQAHILLSGGQTALDLFLSGDDQGHVHIYDISRIEEKPHRITPSQLVRKLVFQAHTVSLMGLVLLEDKKLIATNGTNSEFRLFTLEGYCIGSFGQAKPWDLHHVRTWKSGVANPIPKSPRSPKRKHFSPAMGPQSLPPVMSLTPPKALTPGGMLGGYMDPSESAEPASTFLSPKAAEVLAKQKKWDFTTLSSESPRLGGKSPRSARPGSASRPGSGRPGSGNLSARPTHDPALYLTPRSDGSPRGKSKTSVRFSPRAKRKGEKGLDLDAVLNNILSRGDKPTEKTEVVKVETPEGDDNLKLEDPSLALMSAKLSKWVKLNPPKNKPKLAHVEPAVIGKDSPLLMAPMASSVPVAVSLSPLAPSQDSRTPSPDPSLDRAESSLPEVSGEIDLLPGGCLVTFTGEYKLTRDMATFEADHAVFDGDSHLRMKDRRKRNLEAEILTEQQQIREFNEDRRFVAGVKEPPPYMYSYGKKAMFAVASRPAMAKRDKTAEEVLTEMDKRKQKKFRNYKDALAQSNPMGLKPRSPRGVVRPHSSPPAFNFEHSSVEQISSMSSVLQPPWNAASIPRGVRTRQLSTPHVGGLSGDNSGSGTRSPTGSPSLQPSRPSMPVVSIYPPPASSAKLQGEDKSGDVGVDDLANEITIPLTKPFHRLSSLATSNEEMPLTTTTESLRKDVTSQKRWFGRLATRVSAYANPKSKVYDVARANAISQAFQQPSFGASASTVSLKTDASGGSRKASSYSVGSGSGSIGGVGVGGAGGSWQMGLLGLSDQLVAARITKGKFRSDRKLILQDERTEALRREIEQSTTAMGSARKPFKF